MTRALTIDLGRALALAGVLGLAWTLRDWTALTALRLPDTDDTMRLVQIRDWLGGQAWRDLAQHRLGLGVAMHWTRIADLGPAALIAGLTPTVGRHGAEVAAVIAWPLVLFGAALFLVQRIARAAGGPALAGTAAVIAALAYPATALFAPGRIDHHGLQLVLLLGGVLALLGPATRARGGVQGVLAVTGMTIGLETLPPTAMLGGAAMALWIAGATDARARLIGLALGVGGALIAARILFAPAVWNSGWCDGFTADAWRAGVAGALALAALAAAPARLTPGARVSLALGAATGVAYLVVTGSPRCLSPYGGVDPLLRTLWLDRVAEAQSPFAAAPATAFAYLGVALAGLAAGAWRLARERSAAWAVLLAVQIAALLVAAIQLRGAYPAAMLGTPALAAMIASARRHGAVRLAGAWAASAGMLYPLAAQAVASTPPAEHAAVACPVPSRLSTLPPGRVLAPIDLGPAILLGTRHAVLAAPYHRNNAGNLAVYRFYGGGEQAALGVARRWNVRYVVTCDGSAGMPAAPWARALGRGPGPAWLTPVARTSGAILWRVRS